MNLQNLVGIHTDLITPIPIDLNAVAATDMDYGATWMMLQNRPFYIWDIELLVTTTIGGALLEVQFGYTGVTDYFSVPKMIPDATPAGTILSLRRGTLGTWGACGKPLTHRGVVYRPLPGTGAPVKLAAAVTAAAGGACAGHVTFLVSYADDELDETI